MADTGPTDQPGDDSRPQRLEPEDLTWVAEPELDDPILIAAFAGWNDAGDAATGAVEHLRDAWDGELLATVDAERFYDFTQARPSVSLTGGGERLLEWPRNDFYWAKVPGTNRHAILVSGLEPQLRWRTFTDLFVDVATSCEVSMVLTLGALLADVPHTRPTPVFGSSGNATVAAELGLRPSTYEGPTGIVGVLHSTMMTAGMPSASLWAAVPSYVPGATSPKARLALLERLGELAETNIVIDQLAGDSASYERQVTAYVEQDPDTVTFVAELEQQFDSDPDNTIPTTDGLMDDIERFLRDQQD